ncbi:MAG: cytidylate kinase [Elusimicrobia bacterium RIFOXYD2_FULL_34_15]|nr:MAG: cytidylate kinase [Elusimicrobia bacterium RIFOXYD2_FULL_34_15]
MTNKIKKKLIIAIDGPAGAGKSTIAKLVAKKLKYLYVDTGAMYRAITWKVLNKGIEIRNINEIVRIAGKLEIKLEKSKDKLKVYADSKDVTDEIRSADVTKNVNAIAAIKGVRKILREKQRKIGENGGIVMEGRDIGTVVFPDADKKFYLDAKPIERARRRWQELKDDGKKVSLSSIAASIRSRDYRDRNRKESPLKKAKDAIVINSTSLMPNDVVEIILEKLKIEAP